MVVSAMGRMAMLVTGLRGDDSRYVQHCVVAAMFTGIIRYVGRVQSIRTHGGGARFVIEHSALCGVVSLGDSVAVNGVCLTVASIDAPNVSFDVVAETLERTTLGSLGNQQRVHLETSLRVGDSIDGHFVQGHVDGMGKLSGKDVSGDDCVYWFEHGPELTGLLPPKGSVAIDGVSLTIARVEHSGGTGQNRFGVALIPTTLSETTLGERRIGDLVNLETDIITRTVAHQLKVLGVPIHTLGGSSNVERVTMDALREEGFA